MHKTLLGDMAILSIQPVMQIKFTKHADVQLARLCYRTPVANGMPGYATGHPDVQPRFASSC